MMRTHVVLSFSFSNFLLTQSTSMSIQNTVPRSAKAMMERMKKSHSSQKPPKTATGMNIRSNARIPEPASEPPSAAAYDAVAVATKASVIGLAMCYRWLGGLI